MRHQKYFEKHWFKYTKNNESCQDVVFRLMTFQRLQVECLLKEIDEYACLIHRRDRVGTMRNRHLQQGEPCVMSQEFLLNASVEQNGHFLLDARSLHPHDTALPENIMRDVRAGLKGDEFL